MMMAAGVKNEKSSAALLYFLIPKGAILIGTKEEILNRSTRNISNLKRLLKSTKVYQHDTEIGLLRFNF